MRTPIPVVNVNLAARHGACSPGHHDSPECEPLNIPCPIPRSVTLTLRLGECTENPRYRGSGHHRDCPARPIRVSCSISGKTWEESAPTDLELAPAPSDAGDTYARVLVAVQGRWALVKALVLNLPPLDPVTVAGRARLLALLTQRDAVFAALADMARAEAAHNAAARVLVNACPPALGRALMNIDPAIPGAGRFLVRYVEHLIEQVGALP